MELLKVKNDNIELSQNVINDLKNFKALKVQMDIKEKQLREELLEAMKKYNISSWESSDGSIKASYRKATVRRNIDSTRLKKELPDIAEEYTKVANVKESVELEINV